jgi:hypothetical protein
MPRPWTPGAVTPPLSVDAQEISPTQTEVAQAELWINASSI